MILKIFTVYDSKSEAYLPPFYNSSRGAALRAYSDTVNDRSTPIGAHPADYTLFEMGEFQDETGFIELYSTMINLGVAIEFVVANDNFPLPQRVGA